MKVFAGPLFRVRLQFEWRHRLLCFFVFCFKSCYITFKKKKKRIFVWRGLSGPCSGNKDGQKRRLAKKLMSRPAMCGNYVPQHIPSASPRRVASPGVGPGRAGPGWGRGVVPTWVPSPQFSHASCVAVVVVVTRLLFNGQCLKYLRRWPVTAMPNRSE